METLKVHKCRCENLAIYLSSYKKQYNTDFTLYHLILFETCAPQMCEIYVNKDTETIEYVKKQSTLVVENLRVARDKEAAETLNNIFTEVLGKLSIPLYVSCSKSRNNTVNPITNIIENIKNIQPNIAIVHGFPCYSFYFEKELPTFVL